MINFSTLNDNECKFVYAIVIKFFLQKKKNNFSKSNFRLILLNYLRINSNLLIPVVVHLDGSNDCSKIFIYLYSIVRRIIIKIDNK